MDCPNGSRMVGLPLPKDPMVEILSRVPAESLRELKLVSRDWRDLITDPFHRKRLPQTLEGFFHGGSGDENYGHFTSLFRKSVLEVDPSFSFLTKLPGIERMTLLDSCNGLLLFGYARDSDNFGYIVCNPATK
ncbi:hypothetical protein QOZ80_6BG0465760 [Eleusine coracana subsp. coracana]|nr:hypothetical protein QOZ80_6BG0465760 [Eleusine coracana subsp. coracana]